MTSAWSMRWSTPIADVATDRQVEVLGKIAELTLSRGYPPSMRELGKALGIRSTNGVADHLIALVRRGLLLWEPRLARTMRLTEHGKNVLNRSERPRERNGRTKGE